MQVAVDKLRPGDLLLLENLRFHAAEEANEPEFAAALAALADLYVNDAFGAAHRAHACTEGITHHLPAVAGLLMEREVDALSRLLHRPARPFHAVIGGAKVSGKLEVLEALLSRCQAVLVGGGMANTFLAARGLDLGKSLVEEDQLANARRIVAEARTQAGAPHAADRCRRRAPDPSPRPDRRSCRSDEVPKDQMVVDIGPKTTAAYTEHLAKAKTIFWNGPMGVFEMPQMADGTNAMARVHRQAHACRRRSPSSAAATRWRPSRSSAWPTR